MLYNLSDGFSPPLPLKEVITCHSRAVLFFFLAVAFFKICFGEKLGRKEQDPGASRRMKALRYFIQNKEQDLELRKVEELIWGEVGHQGKSTKRSVVYEESR